MHVERRTARCAFLERWPESGPGTVHLLQYFTVSAGYAIGCALHDPWNDRTGLDGGSTLPPTPLATYRVKMGENG